MVEGEQVGYVQLLGATRARAGRAWLAFSPEKRYQLLAYLAYSGDWVSRERLAYLFWPDTSTEKAQQNLRQLLHRVRAFTWLEGLEVGVHRLRWNVETDVRAFRQALAQGKLDEALSLYKGPLLEGLETDEAPEFSSWLEIEREHLHTFWRDALLKRVQQLQEQKKHQEASKLLSILIDRDPFDEEALAAYLNAASLAGQREQALKTYHDFTRRLQDELGLEPTSTTQRLAQAVQDREHEVQLPPPPARASTPDVTSFPTPVTSFVGRNLEMSEIAHLLSNPGCRLLTLTGPGGIGKTRLAVRAVQELAGCYKDGVYFLPLDALTAPEFIPATIAEVLGIQLQGQDDPLQQVFHYIGKKQLLLILDNFEQLLEGATLASRLVQACSNLKLLVTSRERLDLKEEWLLAIEGLPFPTKTTTTSKEALASDAISLFIQRANQVRSTFTPAEEDLPHIVKVCRLVQGSPLAIELAAVWVRVMSCAEIAQELQEDIDILSTSARNIPERQRSIRATFEHSWKLLTPVEQEILRNLSVFRSGFRKEAAAVVTGAAIAVLASLVDKSLLRVTSTGRYDRHPLVYGYTQEKLHRHPEEEARAQQAHAAYYHRFLRQWGKRLHTSQQKVALRALEEDLGNILVAWRWAIAEKNTRYLKAMSLHLQKFFWLVGRHAEGADVFAQAVAGLNKKDLNHHAALGHALVNQAALLAEHDAKRITLLEAGLALLRPLGESKGVMWGIHNLGLTMHLTGERQQAKQYYQEALALAKVQQDHPITAACLVTLSCIELDSGNYEKSARYAQEALALWREADNPQGVIEARTFLGLATLRMGRPQEAQAIIQGARRLAQDIDALFEASQLTAHLGLSAYALKDYIQARAYFQEALDMLPERSGWQWSKPLLLADLGRVETALGHAQEAKDCFLQSLKLSLPHWWLPQVLTALAGLAELSAKQGQLEQALELSGFVIQHPATEQVHKKRIEQLVAELQHHLSAEVITEALARGKTARLKEAVEQILRQPPLQP